MPNMAGTDPSYYMYVGRWSLKVAAIFIDWLAVPSEKTWLDVGTGPGMVTAVILEQANPAKVVGVDKWEPFIKVAKNHLKDVRVEFHVGDATQLQIDYRRFDVAVAGLVLNFIAAPESAVSNMAGLVKTGGMVAAYVWDYADKMEMLRYFWQAAISIDPAAAERDPTKLYPICHPDKLTELFEGAGLKDVSVIPIDIQTLYPHFHDFWQPFFLGKGSVSKYLRGLKPETYAAIRNQLHHQLPIQTNGTIELMARAWAVKGLK